MAYTIEKMFEAKDTSVYKINMDGIEVYGTETKIACTSSYALEISCARGQLVCGVFSTAVFTKMKSPAALFRGVPHLEDILKQTPKEISDEAAAMGVTMDMTGEQIIRIFEA